MFAYRAARGTVEVAFTDRHGETRGGPGVAPPFDLADAAQARLPHNLRVLARALASGPGASGGSGPHADAEGEGPVMVLLRQVHGDRVHVVTRDDLRPGARPEADAAVTELPGVALVVRVADCVPVLLADTDGRVVGAAHAGRPGLVAGVVPRAVEAMRALGARDLVAWVGPHVCGRCYEVPDQMRQEVAAAVPESFAETSWHTPAVDVGAGVRAQLVAAGVEVVDASRCTREDDDLWSYRRDGAAAGRCAGVVWVRP